MSSDNSFYTTSHEWIKKEKEDIFVMGITEYAQRELSDVVFIDLPEIGAKITKGNIFMSVESVKSASDIYAPITGEVVEVNKHLDTAPETINESAEDKGWFVKIKAHDLDNELKTLLSQDDYAKEIAQAD